MALSTNPGGNEVSNESVELSADILRRLNSFSQVSPAQTGYSMLPDGDECLASLYVNASEGSTMNFLVLQIDFAKPAPREVRCIVDSKTGEITQSNITDKATARALIQKFVLNFQPMF